MITRIIEKNVIESMEYFPSVVIIGPRQVGKTTLAKKILKTIKNESIYLDLESPRDFNKLLDAETYFLQNAEKTIVIDEVQRNKQLFPILRSVIDKDRRPGRFILLGSASPDLIRDSSETLAGRIAYIELSPFLIPEITGDFNYDDLWIKGGFPDAFLNIIPRSRWMQNFIRTYLEKDLPLMGFPAKPYIGERLWSMLAHNHANLLNYNEISKSLEVNAQTVKSYISFLERAFLIRILQPYHFNIKKRVVKTPKVFIRDSGVLHYFLGIDNMNDLFGNLKMGASWEGFALEQIINLLPLNRKTFFYKTHDGAELDLLIEKGGRPFVGIEIKFGSDVRPSKGNTMAAIALKTKHNFIITHNSDDYVLSNGFRVCGIERFLSEYLPEL